MAALWVDTDNAMGSGHGDVDDGFALSFLLAQDDVTENLIVSTVFGNTAVNEAQKNSQQLAKLMGANVPIIQGASSRMESVNEDFVALADQLVSLRILALGPLTNIASLIKRNPKVADRITECIIVGTNSGTNGRWPPFYPMEFNVTQDLCAFKSVWQSQIPLTILPLNIAKSMSFHPRNMHYFPRSISQSFAREIRRWSARCLLLRGRRHFPVWDLGAAIYSSRPEFFRSEECSATLKSNGFVKYGRGNRRVKIIKSIDIQQAWLEYWRVIGHVSSK